MDALSHQIMDYLDSSQSGNERSLKNLCHLIVLLDRYYEHKIKRLDNSLLLHMLSHLAENHVESSSYKIGKEEYLDYKEHVKRLESHSLKSQSLRSSAFKRCVYFAEILLKTLENRANKGHCSYNNTNSETGNDTEINRVLIDFPRA